MNIKIEIDEKISFAQQLNEDAQEITVIIKSSEAGESKPVLQNAEISVLQMVEMYKRLKGDTVVILR